MSILYGFVITTVDKDCVCKVVKTLGGGEGVNSKDMLMRLSESDKLIG